MKSLTSYIVEKYHITKNKSMLHTDEDRTLDIIKATVLSIIVLHSTNSYQKIVNWYQGTDWTYLKDHYDFIAELLNKRFGYDYNEKDYGRGGIISKTINSYKPPINKLIRDKETVDIELATKTVKINYYKDIFQCKDYTEIKQRYKDWFDIDEFPKKGKIPKIIKL